MEAVSTKQVSIIVPVYNMEAFVASGVQCLKEQTYPNIELILIDDGSTDGSGAACEREAGRDSRIRVYHTANRGAGPARNLGMDLARGDYFHFFDIDDYLVPNAISLLVKAAEETGADLVSGGFAVDDHNKNQRVIPKADHLYRTGEQVRNDFYPHMFMFGEQGIFQSACFKLFRAETVRKHGVRFPDLRRNQDEVFLAEYAAVMKDVYFIPDILYRYFANDHTRLFQKVTYDYFPIIQRSSRRIIELVLGWNPENQRVREKLFQDYYYKTFQSIWFLFNPHGKRSHRQRYARMKEIVQAFLDDLPTRDFGETSAVYRYMCKKQYGRLYLRMWYFTWKHRND